MAATTDGQAVMNAARWSDESEYLSEFVAKQKLPLLIKIVKGQCGAIGVPTLPNPGLQSVALLVSAGECRKILAQSIKIKNGRKTANVGPRFTIPDNYGGYFELLSEEGRPMRSIESVSELGRRRLNNGYLVRESVRAIVGKYDENGGLSTDGARIVNAGETIFVEKKVTLDGYDMKLVRCRDANGNIILLSSEQRGKFSVIAKEDNISGVHTAKNLLWKRLPMTVRLVHGVPPRGLKNVDQQFTPEMRLLSTYKEENVFAMPIQRDCSLVVALPLTTPIKLQRARNQHRLQQMEEYQKLLEKCNDLVGEARDKAHVFDGKAGSEWRALRLSCTGGGIFQHNYSSPCNSYFLRRSASASDSSSYQYSYASYELASPAASSSSASENRLDSISSSVVHDVYDEIDEIYEYIRGYGPLPKCMRLPFANGANSRSSPALSASCHNSCSGGKSGGGDRRNGRRDVDGSAASPYFVQDAIVIPSQHKSHDQHEQPVKPEPPPIETIPSSKKLPLGHTRVAIASATSQLKSRKADHHQSSATVTPQPPPIETIPSSSPSSSSSSSKKPLPTIQADLTPSKCTRNSSAPTTPSSPAPAFPYPFNVVTSNLLAVTARPEKRKPATADDHNNNHSSSIYTNCAAIATAFTSSPAISGPAAVGGAFIASAANTVAAIAVLASSANCNTLTESPSEDVKNVPSSGGGGQNSYNNHQVGLLKHYVKSGNSQTRRLLRQKSSSPLKEHHSTPQQPTAASTTKHYSPMFNARYKSLNNLQQTVDLEQSGAGTLDSSHSGGRTSADSNVDGKLPEKKRCKKLSRPRSLTNLVWDMRVTGEAEPGAVAAVDRKFKAATAKLENSPLLRINVNSSSAKTITASPKRIATLYL